MEEPSELTWRLQVAACSIVLFLGVFHMMYIYQCYSRRRPPGQQGTAIFGQTNDILEIIQLIHILVAVIASIGLFVVSWLTTLDFEKFSSAFGLFGALAWVSLEAYYIYWI